MALRRLRPVLGAALAAALMVGGSIMGVSASFAGTVPAFTNPGFESGTTGWTFTGAGTATNNPRTGTTNAYINGGASNSISQQVTVASGQAGTVQVAVWTQAGDDGGLLTLKVNGTQVQQFDVPKRESSLGYLRQVFLPITVAAGDTISLTATGNSAWLNLDDATISAANASAVLGLRNPGFEAGTSGWTQAASGTGTSTNNAHSGAVNAYLDPGKSISQTVTVGAGQAGTYMVSGWTASSGTGSTMALAKNGTTVNTQTVPAVSKYYSHVSFTPVTVAEGDTLTVTVTNASTDRWLNVDDFAVSPVRNQLSLSATGADAATLQALFAWAQQKAQSQVQLPGTPVVTNIDEQHVRGTSSALATANYWAGYPYRSLFYSRDFAHQVTGAYVLGLSAENKAMLQAFAGTAATQNYYPAWSINFDNSTIGAIDYRTATQFYKELPAPFELAQRVGTGYDWTGDAAYKSGSLQTYVNNTVTSFVDAQPRPLNDGTGPGTAKIAQANSADPLVGISTYNEAVDNTYAESSDAVGSQYQAYLAAAKLAAAAGNTAGAATYAQQAADLKSYYNGSWSGGCPTTSANVVRAYTTTGTAITGWGNENSWFAPLKQLMSPGTCRTNYLSYINTQAAGASGPSNIEAKTYLPDTFFNNGDPNTAWSWMKTIYAAKDAAHVTGKLANGDYPEVSFTLVDQVVTGLLGVQPTAGTGVTTTAQLPSSLSTLSVSSIPVGANKVTVAQGASTTSLTNSSGAGSLSWTVRFPASKTTITVGGVTQTSSLVTDSNSGIQYRQATLTVAAGATVTASAS